MITEESFIDFTCPHCEGPVSFPADSAGSVQECPSCGETLIVPPESGVPGGKLPFPISAPRLVLRRFAPGDWRDLMECLSDEEVFRYTSGRPLDEDEVLRWLESDAHVKLTTAGQPLFLGIQLKGPEKLIGYVQLHLDAHRTQASLDVLLHPGYHNQGYGAEAVDAALGFCFEQIRLHRVSGSCDSRNVAGCRLFESVGFRKEGEFIKDRFIGGVWANTVHYAVLDEEWQEASPNPQG